jgi:DNA replication and repair protein RecF
MQIVRGEPSDRRWFLDIELSSLYPSYLNHLAHYKRALEQRNVLLRQAREFSMPASYFEPGEEQIALHGIALRESRQQYISRLNPAGESVHRQMGQGESLQVRYQPKDEAIEVPDLFDALSSQRSNDIARGGTSVGPHRDDLQIEVDRKDSRLYASQGQQRTAVIAIKLATLDVARDENGTVPLLLMDDILSDLDERRRERLVDVVLEKASQAVLTCTEASAAGARILSKATVFQVMGGSICEG